MLRRAFICASQPSTTGVGTPSPARYAFSAAVMFENQRWDAQLAVDYSGEYTEILDSVNGLSQIGDPITYVTASVAYKVLDSLTVSLEGRNLADDYYSATLGGRDDIPQGFETWGRTVILGFALTF